MFCNGEKLGLTVPLTKKIISKCKLYSTVLPSADIPRHVSPEQSGTFSLITISLVETF